MNNAILCRNLSFSYSDKEKLLDQVSLEIKPGEFIGLIGSNGSGKTTLLKLILGLLKPDSGDICIGKDTIRGVKKTSKIANIVPENSKLFLVGPTVIEDLTRIIGDKSKSLTLLKNFNLDFLAEKKLYHLSEGQRRLIAIFNALHQEKEIFILDEPTIGLDRYGINLLLELIKELIKKGKIIIIATNDVRLLPNFSKILGINKGKLSVNGAPNEVLFDLKEKTNIYPNQVTRLVIRLKENIDIPNLINFDELNVYMRNK